MLKKPALAGLLAFTPVLCPSVYTQGTPVSRTYMSPRGAWNSTTTFEASDVVTFGGAAYYSTIMGNVGNTPSLGSAY